MKIFQQIKSELKQYELKDVAEYAEVSVQTLRNWIDGKVENPHLRTITAVADALGYNVVLEKQGTVFTLAA